MATFLSDLVEQLDDRWREVDVLIGKAEEVEDSDPQLYTALSRSVCVLVVAHLEGFTKDLVKAVIHDINANCSFDKLSTQIKRTYAKRYLPNPDISSSFNHNYYLSELIKKLDDTQCKISHEPFLKGNSKNPKPDVIKTIFSNFGITDVFAHLKESELDDIFSGVSVSEIVDAKELATEIALIDLGDFPYQSSQSVFKLEKSAKQNSETTLCQTFIDQINQKRHEVAHGNVFNNFESVLSLRNRKASIQYLQIMLVYLLSTANFLSET
ncbi:HEPN_RiboL-PSP domain-containing protein [Vibrio owensii]|uniref:HEPN_RiboL-PSP domain-containing protein n=1 Tax=Vibrio owensii TaxID=696485 RepID=A0AAU9Q7E6_9VIBR|nr:HEPN_RiboL-PSP domain-containing protein [Vibrio owensii]